MTELEVDMVLQSMKDRGCHHKLGNQYLKISHKTPFSSGNTKLEAFCLICELTE